MENESQIIPGGWLNNSQTASFLEKHQRTVSQTVDGLEDDYPNSFRVYPYRGRPTIFYSPELVNDLAEKFGVERKIDLKDPSVYSSRRRFKEEFASLTAQVKSLREQEYTGLQIQQKLSLSPSQLNILVSGLLKSGHQSRNKGAPIRVSQDRFLEVLYAKFPTSVVFSELGDELGLTRERVRQRFYELARLGHTLPPLRSGLRINDPEFDKQVDKLRKQGLKNSEIAVSLNLNIIQVDHIVGRLHQTRKKELEETKSWIRDLRNHGLGTSAIARITGVSSATVDNYLGEMMEAGEAKRLRKKRATESELTEFKRQVIFLRDDEHLSQLEIAKRLDCTKARVTSIVNKLLQEGQVQKKLSMVSKNDQEILKLRKLDVTHKDISQKLQVSKRTVERAVRRLKYRGLL